LAGEVRGLTRTARENPVILLGMLSAALTLLLFAAEPDALKKAQAHLDTGALDEVLFALDGKSFEGEQKARAAAMLGKAARKAQDARDLALALQFAQMALKHDQKEPLALEVAARASLAQEQFEPAEQYAERWVAATGQPVARLFRAQLAHQQGDWAFALKTLDGVAGAEATALRAKAEAELRARKPGATAMESAMRAQGFRVTQESSEPSPPPPARAPDIVLYRTRECRACDQTRDHLLRLRVEFLERDVEVDAAAARELAARAVAARLVAAGVPWTDARGTLVGGFNPREINRALKRMDPGVERLLRR
jgi:tetratricopeptide (TPR) repeat protein